MALYHLHAQVVKRSAGMSAVAGAAYRAGECLVDDRTGEMHDYRRRRDVATAEILAPAGAPAWARDRSALWNQAERAERQHNGQPAREIRLAIPAELGADAGRALVRDYATAEFVNRGMVADLAIHGEDGANPHAHILLTMRTLDGDAFSRRKNRDWNTRETLQEWRAGWADAANAALEHAGHAERIDDRTLVDQHDEALQAGDLDRARALDRPPTLHRGRVLTHTDAAPDRAAAVAAREEEIAARAEALAQIERTAAELRRIEEEQQRLAKQRKQQSAVRTPATLPAKIPEPAELIAAVRAGLREGTGAPAMTHMRDRFEQLDPETALRPLVLQATDPELLQAALGPGLAPAWVDEMRATYRKFQAAHPRDWEDVEKVWREQRAKWRAGAPVEKRPARRPQREQVEAVSGAAARREKERRQRAQVRDAWRRVDRPIRPRVLEELPAAVTADTPTRPTPPSVQAQPQSKPNIEDAAAPPSRSAAAQPLASATPAARTPALPTTPSQPGLPPSRRAGDQVASSPPVDRRGGTPPSTSSPPLTPTPAPPPPPPEPRSSRVDGADAASSGSAAAQPLSAPTLARPTPQPPESAPVSSVTVGAVTDDTGAKTRTHADIDVDALVDALAQGLEEELLPQHVGGVAASNKTFASLIHRLDGDDLTDSAVRKALRVVRDRTDADARADAERQYHEPAFQAAITEQEAGRWTRLSNAERKRTFVAVILESLPALVEKIRTVCLALGLDRDGRTSASEQPAQPPAPEPLGPPPLGPEVSPSRADGAADRAKQAREDGYGYNH